MNSARKIYKIPAERSPSLPGLLIDANVCRTPGCKNFGISGDILTGAKHGYSFPRNKKSISHKCGGCQRTHQAYSNISILNAFYRCLPNSIPYASCPDPGCDNHHINLFENYHGDLRDKHKKYYRIHANNDSKQNYQAKCRRCRKSFTLSKALGLHTSKRRFWKKEMETFIRAVVNGSGPSDIMNILEVHPQLYYTQLRAASNVLLKYNNFHLTKLMQIKGMKSDEPMRIYTDCIVCSIKLNRRSERHFKMKIIVSSCRYNKRSLILAFHPLFDQQEFDPDQLISDSRLPLGQRQYEYVKHRSIKKKNDPIPPRGRGGLLMDDFHAYMSHFLVLRKLLARTPSLQFYMDGESNLYNAALTVFADRIKSHNCDIVIRVMKKNNSQSRTSEALNEKMEIRRKKWRKAYKNVHSDSGAATDGLLRRFMLEQGMKSVSRAIKSYKSKNNNTSTSISAVEIYKAAINSPDGEGKAYWVTNELPDKYNAESRMLWLTRTTERSCTDYELDLYLNGAIFYIDNVFSAFRQRSSLAARPRVTATGHKSYNRNPELPGNLIGDFTINAAYWNFFLKYRSEPKETIAYVHGLVKTPMSPKIMDAFINRYSFTSAKRITKWLGT